MRVTAVLSGGGVKAAAHLGAPLFVDRRGKALGQSFYLDHRASSGVKA